MTDRRDLRITGTLLAAGLVMAGLAWITTPGTPAPEIFTEEGEPLFQGFEDPTAAASVEIITYKEDTANSDPFKVERKKGVWIIPSHQNYPAEAGDRLNKTAAQIIMLRKDSLRSDRKEDHVTLGVADPMDAAAAGLKGIGTRVTLRDETDRVLADFIVGQKRPDDENHRFVRIAGKNRTYSVTMKDIDLSADFYDWIERDLLKIDKEDLRRIDVDGYHVDEALRQIVPGESLKLTRDESDWKLEGMAEAEKIEKKELDDLLAALDDLKIVDVLKKPEGLSRELKQQASAQLTQEDVLMLRSKGFFITPDGRLVSNEGELRAWNKDGVRYTLRFGELAGGGDQSEERRYLFVTADFDKEFLPEPQGEDKKKEWLDQVEKGKGKAKELNDRFADWYYIIPGVEFKKSRLTRSDLVRLEKTLWDADKDAVKQISVSQPKWGLSITLQKKGDDWIADLAPGFTTKAKSWWVDRALEIADTLTVRELATQPEVATAGLTADAATRAVVGDNELWLGSEDGENRYVKYRDKIYVIDKFKVSALMDRMDSILELKLFDWKAGDVASVTIHTPEKEAVLEGDALKETARRLAELKADELMALAKVQDEKLTAATTWIAVTLPENRTITLTIGGSPSYDSEVRHCAFSDRAHIARIQASDLEEILKGP